MDFGIISKLDNHSLVIVDRLVKLLEGNSLYLEKNLRSILRKGRSLEEASSLDYLIWIGGDGTLLKYTDYVRRLKVKLLGIKTGSLGFLCEISPEELELSLRKLFSNEYFLEERKLLSLKFRNKVEYALNDALFFVSKIGKVSRFSLMKDGLEVFSGKCDGLLISTSLGSTAYIASRGGPVVDPSLDLLIVDPINPLRWGARTLILPFNSNLEVTSEKGFSLVIDGNITYELEGNEKVSLTGSNESVYFVRFKNNFYEKIKKRSMMDV